jgi:hypothetical protein
MIRRAVREAEQALLTGAKTVEVWVDHNEALLVIRRADRKPEKREFNAKGSA